MRFETGVSVARPIDEVFAFLSDFTNLPLWNYYILTTAPEDSGPPRLGLRYRQTRKKDTQHFEICEFVPDKVAAIRMLPPTRPVIIRFVVRPVDQGTWAGEEWSLNTGLPIPRPIAALMTWPIKSAVAQNLMKPKTLLETGSVVLQDGRRTKV